MESVTRSRGAYYKGPPRPPGEWSLRLRREPHGPPREHEDPLAAVVDRPGRRPRPRDPRPHHLEDEEVVAVDPPRVVDPALEVRPALVDERRLHLRRRERRQPDPPEL